MAKQEEDFIKALRKLAQTTSDGRTVLNPAAQYKPSANAGAITYRRGTGVDPMTPVILNPEGNNPATIQAHERDIMNGIAISPADQYGNTPYTGFRHDPDLEDRLRAENSFMNNIRNEISKNDPNAEKASQIASPDFIKGFRDSLANVAKFFGIDTNAKKESSPATNSKQPATTQSSDNKSQSTNNDSSDDYIEYTYKKGDTFGQVIKDLGLKTNKGLWGSDGDVAYYTKQLRQQGIPGMVPIGTKIRLKRRK